MTLLKDYTAEDLQNAFDKGRITGRGDVYDNIAELDQESRLMRARCERLQGELDTAEQTIHELKDQLHVEKLSHKDMANVLNNYEEEITRLRGIVNTMWDAVETYGPEYMHGNHKNFYRKQFQSAIRASS